MGHSSPQQATRQYTGERLERGFFDNIVRFYASQYPQEPYPRPSKIHALMEQISTLTNFFANRHLSEDAAKSAHRRVYFMGEGEESGSKSLGGAAAYQAFL